MSDRLRLGPDPNRTYLERWNEMHPDRYGRPDSPADSGHGWQRGHANDDPDASGDLGSFLDSMLGLAILVLAPLTGAITTLLIYRWTAPDQLTTGWILSYAGTFLVASWIGATLVYAARRLLLAVALVGITFRIAHFAWNLLIA